MAKSNKNNKRYYYNLKNFNIVKNRKIEGKWTLVRQLGQGGNGEVWQCRDASGRNYAIKFLKSSNKEPYSRFYDEVVFMESYDSLPEVLPIIAKHIPPVNERNKNKETPFYYVMPLAKPINKDIYNESIDNKVDIIRALLEMMVKLHDQGVAHRDIKPANILLYEGNYVLSDFGLVFFQGKTSMTPPNISLGAKWTRSPQMERDAMSANKFKSDVYAMAKTIWMIFTGDFTSFEGQYDPSSSFLSLRKYIPVRYITPLESLLSRCTDHEEDKRPTAKEMLDGFNDWVEITHNWDRENLLEWVEIQQKIFPLYEPDHCEWTELERIVGVLKMLGSYDSLNHMFLPGCGGLDLNSANLAKEEGWIELDCGLPTLVHPTKLCFERISDDYQWNYFRLELTTQPPSDNRFKTDEYIEEYGEVIDENMNYVRIPVWEYDNLDKEEVERKHARHITRFLRGSMVIFHKNSIYNQLISEYKGEHDKMSPETFKVEITKLSKKFYGKTISDLKKLK